MSSITRSLMCLFNSHRAVRAGSLALAFWSAFPLACSSDGGDSAQGGGSGASTGGKSGSSAGNGAAHSGNGGESGTGVDAAGSNVSDGGDDAPGASGATSAIGGNDSGGGTGPAGGSGASFGGADQSQGGTLSDGGGGSSAGGSTAGASCFVDHDCVVAGGVCTGSASASVCVNATDVCTSGADCSRKQYCDGYCRPAADFGQPCSSQGHCGSGPPGYRYPLVCNGGRCLVPYETLSFKPYPCYSNEDCADGLLCRLAGISSGYAECLSPAGPYGRCSQAADCGGGLCCVLPQAQPTSICQAKTSCSVTGVPLDCNTRACSTGTHCDYVQENTCLANLPEGSDCTPVAGKESYGSIPCAQGLYCAETADHLLRCQASPGEGQTCVLPRAQAAPGQPACSDSFQLGCSPCANGLYCDTGNTCRRFAGYHEDCAARPCSAGLRCAPAMLGGSCSGNPDSGAGGAGGANSGSGGATGSACSDPPTFKNPALAAAVDDQRRRAGVSKAAYLQALIYVGDYDLGDLSGLECLTGLKSLTLQGSAIRDLSPLAALTQLTNLQVQETAISDLHALSGLSGLSALSLRASAIVDLSPLAGLSGLTTLTLSGNAIVDLAPLSGLVQLKTLDLSSNQILNLGPLLVNPALATGSTVTVTSNPFDCAAQAVNMKALTDRGALLTASCPLHCDGTPPQNPASKVATGAGSNCVLLRDGRVECWGGNAHDELGDGTTVDSSVPVVVLGVSGAVDVSEGGYGGCALLSNGNVSCWGTIIGSSVPSVIAGVSQASAVATDGGSLSCVIVSNGKVRCWGLNAAGGWGDGSQPGQNVTSRAPTSDVLGISNAISIAVGDASACAVLSDGSLWCWGADLGDGTNVNSSNVPVRVTGISNARKVAAGTSHRCVILSDSTVSCWGGHEIGSPLVPTPVPGLTHVVDVSLGRDRRCALLENGTVRCWGKAPLGDGLSTDSDTPVLVSGITNAISVGVGMAYSSACAVLADGSIRCWVTTTDGQLLTSPDCIPKL